MTGKVANLLNVANLAGLNKSIISALISIDNKIDEELWLDLLGPEILETLQNRIQNLIDKELLPQLNTNLIAMGILYLEGLAHDSNTDKLSKQSLSYSEG